MMILRPESEARRSIRRHSRVAVTAVVILVGGLGGWSVATEISGAVAAAGNVVVETNAKKVQHPTGGVVGQILARDGDRVRAGDVVIRLDETVARANAAMLSKGLGELAARQARLEAERDGQEAMAPRPDGLDTEAYAQWRSEARLFEHRRQARDGQKAQLRERVAQLDEQIAGLRLQAAAKADEIKLIQEELGAVEHLWRQNLVAMNRVTLLRREETRLRGEHGQIVSSVAQARGRISETQLQILQIDQDLRSETAKELREVEAKILEMVERRVAAEDQLSRIEIRAPQDGIVYQSAVHTVGGVIAPGEQLMLIMPEADNLTVEVKVAPQDIDQLLPGQDTVLRLSALNQRTTPELRGNVRVIAADLMTDQRSGLQYYPVRIAIAEGEEERLGAARLVPGMPVESFIRTGERTVLSYLTKPMSDYFTRAFREE
ncbi:HlyD family type I secretion periplasmic adaptor subunit [Belnapia rosea]|uniref:Membrane fusion protein (MFP) family protein n=1 Tax=Belnapia rosea TaxID=938405 RepID=A0A1G6VHI7_9PROT|nr:HlyD family type I secretion periplasmic adaptor subunit [Belnapia rosea]SDD52517.1 membrane fusion protein PrsE [Belnapia rosea]